MKMTKKEYSEYVDMKSPNSPIWGNLLKAFVIGGIICCIGQAIKNMYLGFALEEETAATATSITLVFVGAFLTAIGVYDKIAKRAGAGTLVPITGFANSVVSPAMEFKSEGFVLGLGAKMFTIAGPVIVYGTAASVVYGLVYWIIKMV